MFSFENEVEIGLETTSNVEANEAWEILTPKMLVNQICGLQLIDVQAIGFFGGK
jgi:hypothetical protein